MSIREQRRLRYTRPLERNLQASIREAIGKEPGLVLFRNTVGETEEFDPVTATARWIVYGLHPGATDLVGALDGRWFSLEVKRPGQKRRPNQMEFAGMLHRVGAFCAVVTSPDEARAAVVRCRQGALE